MLKLFRTSHVVLVHAVHGMEKNAEHLLRKERKDPRQKRRQGLLKGRKEAMKEDVIYATFNLMYLILSGD